MYPAQVPKGRVTKGLTLPENYIHAMRRRNVNLSQLIEIAWRNWIQAGRRQWPQLVRGATRRKRTTVTVSLPTAQSLSEAERNGMEFSAWVETVMQEAYPQVFMAGGQVAWV